MSSLATASTVFACLFCGALAGMGLRGRLPPHHLDDASKEVVKLATALIGTMGALVLGLMISSAKSSYDARANGVVQLAAYVVQFDRVLAHYGPAAAEIRAQLQRSLTLALERYWPADGTPVVVTEPTVSIDLQIYDRVQSLAPSDASQSALQARAAALILDMGQLRTTLFQRTESSIPSAFLVFLTFWFTVIFVSFGLFAPRHLTMVFIFLAGALSLAGAVFLILEFDRSFEGMLKVSGTPLRAALAAINR